MATVYLGLGSNLGCREANINNAINELKSIGLKILKESSIIETEPRGYEDQDKFLNSVLKCLTDFSPYELLFHLKSIESKLGRVKTIINGPRNIDIDILLYDTLRINSDELVIPHPHMLERDFVMLPLKEIEPNIEKDIFIENRNQH